MQEFLKYLKLTSLATYIKKSLDSLKEFLQLSLEKFLQEPLREIRENSLKKTIPQKSLDKLQRKFRKKNIEELLADEMENFHGRQLEGILGKVPERLVN